MVLENVVGIGLFVGVAGHGAEGVHEIVRESGINAGEGGGIRIPIAAIVNGVRRRRRFHDLLHDLRSPLALRRVRDLSRVLERQVRFEEVTHRLLAVTPALGPEAAVEAGGRVLQIGQDVILPVGEDIGEQLRRVRGHSLESQGSEDLADVGTDAVITRRAVIVVTVGGQVIEPLLEQVDGLALQCRREARIAIQPIQTQRHVLAQVA